MTVVEYMSVLQLHWLLITASVISYELPSAMENLQRLVRCVDDLYAS